MNFYVSLEGNTIIGGSPASAQSQAQASAGTVVPPPSGAADQAAAGQQQGWPWWSWVLIYAVIIVGFYLLFMRPQSQKQKKEKAMQASLKVGDTVVTNAGFFGTIVDVGGDSFIIEFGTNKGVRVPVLKSSVVGAREPNLSVNAEPVEEKVEKPGFFGRR